MYSQIPRGDQRKSLEKSGRIKDVSLHRQMSDCEVESAILDAFKWVHCYKVLCVDNKGAHTNLASVQNPSGEEVINKRGFLYLEVVECDDYVVSWS